MDLKTSLVSLDYLKKIFSSFKNFQAFRLGKSKNIWIKKGPRVLDLRKFVPIPEVFDVLERGKEIKHDSVLHIVENFKLPSFLVLVQWFESWYFRIKTCQHRFFLSRPRECAKLYFVAGNSFLYFCYMESNVPRLFTNSVTRWLGRIDFSRPTWTMYWKYDGVYIKTNSLARVFSRFCLDSSPISESQKRSEEGGK